MGYGGSESSHCGLKLGHVWREAKPTAGVGLPGLSWPWVSGGCVGHSLVGYFSF
jgi:hypothetical protein